MVQPMNPIDPDSPLEPQIEGLPESESWFYTLSKYGGDYFFPPEVAENPSPLFGFAGAPSAISREQFFSEVRSHFSHIPWTDRATRAREQARDQIPQFTPTGQPVPFNEPPSRFMEDVEQRLLAKFRPDERRDSVYRMKREKERKEGQKKEFIPQVMTKAELLKDLADKIGSVQWKERNPNHAAKVGSRPGVSKRYKEELDAY